MSQFSTPTVESILQDELLQADDMIDSAGPILRHLLANNDHSMFSDEIVARVRGMIAHLARQLLHAQADADGADDPQAYVAARFDALNETLLANAPCLNHAHGLALEWQLAERFEVRNGMDPVLSPLLQALLAAREAAMAETAMALLAAQSRFTQQQRRMELPLGELPGDLFHAALLAMRACAADTDDEAAARAEATLRATFDESGSRLGLLSRVITAMGGGAVAALSIAHAGVALFLTALGLGFGQDRNLVILSTNETQMARLALSLRAAGLKPAVVEQQFAYFHPDIALPDGFDTLRVDRAAALLDSAASGQIA